MDTVTLWRSGELHPGECWFFWQKSQPYLIGSLPVRSFCLPAEWPAIVFALGGRLELWRGPLGCVPLELRSYLSEVCVTVSLGHEQSAPTPPPQAP